MPRGKTEAEVLCVLSKSCSNVIKKSLIILSLLASDQSDSQSQQLLLNTNAMVLHVERTRRQNATKSST